MIEIIENHLQIYKHFIPDISDEELLYLRENITVTEFKKKSFYLKAGQVQKSLGYLHKGLLRAFYVDSDGKEITMEFIQENEYATHYHSFSEQSPSKYFFQCLEPCTIINLPYEKMMEGIKNYKNFEQYARVFKGTIAIKQQNRIESLVHENAEVRYLNFVNNYPKLFNRISLTHLSSYLGLGRQSISRIRNKITSK